MKNKLLMGVSILSCLAAVPALAESGKSPSSESISAKIETTADDAGASIEKAADKAGDTVKDAYKDMKAYFTDDGDVKAVTNLNVLNHVTAKDLIGRTVQDAQGKDIGKIHDILITKDGDAESVVIENGGIAGIGGKLAVFDFDIIEGMTGQKDVVVKLSDESLKKAHEFVYEAPKNSAGNVIFLPADRYSVDKILAASVIDPQGRKLAVVDTVAFDGDDADYVIVTFDRIMGMGGKKAALDMDALDLVKTAKGDYQFKLNAQQTAQFENFKQTTKAN